MGEDFQIRIKIKGGADIGENISDIGATGNLNWIWNWNFIQTKISFSPCTICRARVPCP